MKRTSCLLLATGWLAASLAATAQTYGWERYTMDSGGGESAGGIYAIKSTLGQPDAGGPMRGGIYSFRGGFWAESLNEDPVDLVWTNVAGGNWNVAANWWPQQVPRSNDHARIIIPGGYTVTLDTAATIGSLTLNAGTLSGVGTLTVTNLMNWTGGTMAGSGRTVIAPGATNNIAGAITLSGRTLENAGITLWTGNVSFFLDSAAVITNRPEGLVEARGNATLQHNFGTLTRFDNAGTFRKTLGTGSSTLAGLAFNNYNAVEIQTGTLLCSGNCINNGSVTLSANTTNRMSFGGSGSGTFTAPATALVEWSGGSVFVLNPGAQLNGGGLYKVSGGTLTCNATLAVPNLDVGATLDGSGTMTVSNVMNWSAGAMNGSGRTLIAPGASLNFGSAGGFYLRFRTLENAGTATWTGAGPLYLESGAVITNRGGAVFEAQNNATLQFNGGAAARFDNAGIFRKTIGTTTTILAGLAFNNYNAVEIQTGTLLCNAVSVNNGTITLSAGTTNRLTGGGASSGAFVAAATSLVEWTGGSTFVLNPGAQLNGGGLYKVGGGTLTCNATLAVPNLDLSATLDGSGILTVSNVLNWSAGAMNGSGRTLIASGAALNFGSAGGVFLRFRTLENAGTATWTGAGPLYLESGAVITNRGGAVFEAQSNATLQFNGGAAARFDNAGTLRKTLGTGTNTLAGFAFNNYNAVEIQTGTLLCNNTFNNNGSVSLAAGTTNRMAAGGSSSGSFTAPATSLVEWTGGSTFVLNPGAQLNGGGLYKVGGGTLTCNATLAVPNLELSATLDGSGILTVSNVLNWLSGPMAGSGRTVIAPGATLNMVNPGTITLSFRTLENAGTVLWTGAGFLMDSGAVITNRPGALFEARNNVTLTHNFGVATRFDNAGIFRKTLGTGTTTLAGFAFNNYNAVELQTGTLLCSGNCINNGSVTLWANTTNRMSNGGSGSGTFTALATALVEWTAGDYFLNPGAQLDGAGLYRVSGGTLYANATLAVQNFGFTGGFLSGSAVLTISNAMSWTGGTMTGSGRTVIAPGATLSLPNVGPVTLSIRTLENAGTILWTGAGSLMFDTGAIITNRAGALFEAQNNSPFQHLFGAPTRFDNAGVFRKTTGTATSTFTGLALNNYNTVEIRSGIIAANGGYTCNSGSLLSCNIGGTVPGTGHGRLQVSGAVTLAGALSVNLTNGFYPAASDLFGVVTAGTRSGAFASFYYPSNEVSMAVSNSATAATVFINNLRPSANTDTLARGPGISLKIPIATLLANDIDPELTALTLAGVNLTTTNGVTLTTNATTIFYANPNNVNDRFTYVIRDANNLTGIGTVLVNLASVSGNSAIVSLQVGVPGPNTNTLTLSGIPGYPYTAQFAINPAGPWLNLRTDTAPTNGVWTVIDDTATNVSRFYRSATP